ncbi:MAG TPA: SpoIIE family protein phosphatase, partial [Flavobacteriales bacterium]|nr:SpoIIE family protein phosphatase [Flavobacteriales bacterium]
FYFQALTLDQVEFSYMLEGLDDKWTPMSTKNEADYTNIPPGEYTFRVKAINSDGITSKVNLAYKFTINPPFWQTWWFRITAGVITIALIVFIVKRRTAQLAKEKKILEEKVAERTSELRVANSHLSVALHDIKDSIYYAQKIQQSILPNDQEFVSIMNDAFVLFKPKDIVSGDFYWLTQKNGKTIYATCDCTGHGVPGGFMTMLGTSFLNEIVNEQKASETGKVLDQMRERIIEALKQTGAAGENKDGMDMVMCEVDKQNYTLRYAAANNGFYIVHNGELVEMKADKQPIGYFINQQPFTTGTFKLQKGDVIYTFTDGYADQFGGPNGKKFKYKQLEQLLLTIYTEPMQVQKQKLDDAIENWMKDFEQVDDILIIGYRVV